MNDIDDAYAEARRLLLAIEARELREAVAVEREAVAAELQRREQLYRAARAAADEWRPGAGKDPELERLRRHVIDLALEDPPITVHWLGRDSATERLVQKDNAVALTGHRAVLVQAVINEPTYVSVLHEFGHIRAPRSGGPLQQEAAAWRYARQVALVWTRECQQTMVSCLNTYLAIADRTTTNLMGALEIDRLCGSFEYAQERHRRLEQEIKRDAARNRR